MLYVEENMSFELRGVAWKNGGYIFLILTFCKITKVVSVGYFDKVCLLKKEFVSNHMMNGEYDKCRWTNRLA